MYCPKCGGYNDNENIWCIYCGHGKLPSITEPEAVPVDKSPVADVQVENMEVTVEAFTETETQNDSQAAEPEEQYAGVHFTGRSGYEWNVRSEKAKDYLVLAIISAVFGSVIFGVVAIIFSAMTKSENEVSNYVKAKEYSSKAKLFSVIALIIGASKYIFAIALIAMVISGGFFYLF